MAQSYDSPLVNTEINPAQSVVTAQIQGPNAAETIDQTVVRQYTALLAFKKVCELPSIITEHSLQVLTFLALVLVFYLIHTFGEAIGLHRLLSHHSFRCPKWLEYFWVFSAYLAFQGSPIWWATIHRAHHRYVDTPLDPHAPGNGMFGAYTFYSPFKYADHIDPAKQSKDLLKDPIYSLLECGGNWRVGYALCVVICICFRVLLFFLFGWTVALASLVAGIIALNMPLALNVVCHIPKLGSRNYDTPDESVNVWWMSVLCLGEGWHNNHHAFPGAARAGIKPHEIDLCWLLLLGLRKIGLIYSLNEPGSALLKEPEPDLISTNSRARF